MLVAWTPDLGRHEFPQSEHLANFVRALQPAILIIAVAASVQIPIWKWPEV